MTDQSCKITTGLMSGEVEMVLIENDRIRLKVLADRGADLVEIYYKSKNLDFAWRTSGGLPVKKVANDHPAEFETFRNGYAGGWQTIFPNGGAVSTYKGITYSQHDEVATMQWRYEILSENTSEVSVKFYVTGVKAPFLLEKTYTLRAGHNSFEMSEIATNLSGQSHEVMWGSHITFGSPFLDENSFIHMPQGTSVFADRDNAELGRGRMRTLDSFPWPLGKNSKGEITDFSKLPPMKTANEMFYLKDFPRGCYEVESPTWGVKAKVSWDKDVFPYLWFWQEYGADDGYPWFGKHYNIGLEPFSSYPTEGLAKAVENGSAITFSPHEIKKNTITFEIEEI
jgi:hypothetical protein